MQATSSLQILIGLMPQNAVELEFAVPDSVTLVQVQGHGSQ